MTFFRVLVILETIVVAVALIRWARVGYRRRRAHWTRGSWIRFGLAFGLALIVSFIPVAGEFVTVDGYPWREGLSQNAQPWYALTVVALAVIGAGIAVTAVAWFAHGEPTRQFPGETAGSPRHPA